VSASEDFVKAYIEAALWSSTDHSRPDGGDPLDDKYSEDDLAPETLARMREDCDKFVARCGYLLDKSTCRRGTGEYSKDAQAGHDFWLNRNGHGVGFWDGDWLPEELGEQLSQGAKGFREFNLYVGDDGKVHGE